MPALTVRSDPIPTEAAIITTKLILIPNMSMFTKTMSAGRKKEKFWETYIFRFQIMRRQEKWSLLQMWTEIFRM